MGDMLNKAGANGLPGGGMGGLGGGKLPDGMPKLPPASRIF